jgi:hypothetical protein
MGDFFAYFKALSQHGREKRTVLSHALGSGGIYATASAHSETVGADAEIPLRPRMQVCPTGFALGEALLLDAYSGSAGVDAVVTALVLAVTRPSVSAPSDGRTDPSAMRSVRACGGSGAAR